MDMISTLALLEQRIREGFCLHGSQARLEVVEPRQANCQSGRPEGNLTAVYASRHCVQVPIVMGLLAGKGLSSYTGDDGIHLKVTGDRTFAPGFIHVLECKTFADVNGEFVSFVPVIPREVIAVKPSILRLLVARGTLDLQIPIPAPW